MEALRKLHKMLKEDKSLKELIKHVEEICPIIAEWPAEDFSVSKEHERICTELEQMRLNTIEEAFLELPMVPEITGIILSSSKWYTLAFLMIPAGRVFGWHDHTKMNGISKCVAGNLTIRSLNPAFLEPCGAQEYYYPC
jgi:hypothetical protein